MIAVSFPSISIHTTFSPYQWARSLAVFAPALFVVCMAYGYLFLSSDPALQELHTLSLRSYLFDWSGAGSNFLTLIFGSVISAVYGFILGGVFAFCLNHCQPKEREHYEHTRFAHAH